MNDIRIESERLARLVEDLLVMTRVERGTVEISDEPILVQRLLPSVIHSFNGQRPDVKVALNLSERLSAVRGDPTYVEQVVRNLLTNAVRYGRAAETGIEVIADELEGEVRVRVLDRGPGLSRGQHGTAVRALLPLGCGTSRSRRRRHRTLRVPPPHRGDGRPHLGQVATGRRRRVRLHAAGGRVGHLRDSAWLPARMSA